VTIGFLHLTTPDSPDEGTRCARAMVASARSVMPRVRIVQFTDLQTKGIKGVDEVRRKPIEPMGLLRMRHCAGVPGEWLFVDTDIIFQRPVAHVFNKPFDVALTTRDWTHVKAAGGFSERMPFNTGVVFSRCPHFWGEAYARLRDMDADLQHFMGEQQVINDLASDGRYQIRKLRGSIYNYPPEVPGAVPTSQQMQAEASILHYKGRFRKSMMLQEVTKCA
jgi:hypothetical protein